MKKLCNTLSLEMVLKLYKGIWAITVKPQVAVSMYVFQFAYLNVYNPKAQKNLIGFANTKNVFTAFY